MSYRDKKGFIFFVRSANNKNIMGNVYIRTHIRFSPWLIGVIAGYVFYEAREKMIRIPRVRVFVEQTSLIENVSTKKKQI